MSINNGSKMLLQILHKVANDDRNVVDNIEPSSEFITIGGMRTTRIVYNNQIIDKTNKESGQWREILAEAGISSLSISASGIFMNTASEKMIRENCFMQRLEHYRILFANKDTLEGKFFISSYERNGNYGEEENYNLAFESSGKIYYTKN